MRGLWKRLAALAAAAGVASMYFRPPATAAVLDAAEQAMGLVLPESYRQTLLFADGQGVTCPHSGQGLVEAGPVAVGAGQPFVGIDPLSRHPHRQQRLALRGQILFVGGAAGIARQQLGIHTLWTLQRAPDRR